MGLGNFIKRTAGIGRLPKDQLNEFTVMNLLKKGATFIVALPSFQTVSAGVGESVSAYQGGIRTTFHTPAPKKRVQRRILTNINYNNGQITIQHAQNNGAHIFINANSIAKVGKLKNGIIIELAKGLQYQFLMDKKIKNMWKELGFNPQFVIDVFYNLIISGFQTSIKTPAQNINYQNSIPSKPINDKELEEYQEKSHEEEKQKELKIHEKAVERALKKDRLRIESNKNKREYSLEIPCPACGKMIKYAAVRCKYCKTMLNKYKDKPEYQEMVRKYKEKQKNDLELKKIEEKEKQYKSCPNCGEKIPPNAIRCKYCKTMLKEYSSNNSDKKQANAPNLYHGLNKNNPNQSKKSKKINNSEKIKSEDKSPFEKIKEAKELLDIGAITQEEYDKIKAKYIDKL